MDRRGWRGLPAGPGGDPGRPGTRASGGHAREGAAWPAERVRVPAPGPSLPRGCVDRILAPQERLAAAEAAVAENPANLPLLVDETVSGPLTRVEAAAVTGRRWRPGRTLRVHLLDGDPPLWRRVEAVAREWTRHANLRLEFGSGPGGDLRISLRPDGRSWSFLGTDALVVDLTRPTMNLGWTAADPSEEALRGVVLHEFGHALGFPHPPGGPSAAWQAEAACAFFGGPPNYWSRVAVEREVFRRYGPCLHGGEAPDLPSALRLPVPPELVEDGRGVPWPAGLSGEDIRRVASGYPDPVPGPIPLATGGEVRRRVRTALEEDRFELRVTEPGPHRFEAEGDGSLRLLLVGPEDPRRAVARAAGPEARVAVLLVPGTYWLRVGFQRRTPGGEYRVRFRRETARIPGA